MSQLDATLGVSYIGVVLAATLYGVACLQVFYYFNRFPGDWWYIKLLVVTVWILDGTHQALITHTLYTYLITHYAQVAYLSLLVWSLIVEVIFNGITAFLVQSFFTVRIWRLSGKNIALTVVVYALVLAEFGSVIAYVSKALPMSTFEQLSHLRGLSMTVNALAAAGDILIAASLCLMLHRSRTGFKQSDTIINKLMIFTVNTGLLTSICAVISLITIAVSPNTFIYICFYFLMGRLYSNSLFATLNVRLAIRGLPAVEDTLPLSLQDAEHSGTSGSSGNMGGVIASGGWRRSESKDVDVRYTAPRPDETETGISIRIDTTQEVHRDRGLSFSGKSPPPKAGSLPTKTESSQKDVPVPAINSTR